MSSTTLKDAICQAADELRNLDGLETRRPDHASRALLLMVWKLRRGEDLTDRERACLADALERAVDDPRKAGAALGLVQKRSRGLTPQEIYDEVGADVWRYHFVERLPLTANRDTEGAFAKVAEIRGIPEKTVEEYYYKASLRYRVP